MASSSSQGRPNPRPQRSPNPPQVFISFLGVEVRDSLVKHLEQTLLSREVNVFTDNFLQVGLKLEHLFKDIEESKIAVVIFSQRFPDSDWCMEELVKIDKLAEEGKLVVIPVFYKVSISDVKNLKGNFGENFKKLKQEYAETEPEKVIKWEASVKSIAGIKGLRYDNNGKILPPLPHRIAAAIQVWLNKMPGGKVKPRKTELTLVEVVFLAFAAALFGHFVISPVFFSDANFLQTRGWLFGFPTAMAILFCISSRKYTPPGTRPTPSTTRPPPPPAS